MSLSISSFAFLSFEFEKINFSSGHEKFGVEMNTKDLHKVLKYKMCDFSY